MLTVKEEQSNLRLKQLIRVRVMHIRFHAIDFLVCDRRDFGLGRTIQNRKQCLGETQKVAEAVEPEVCEVTREVDDLETCKHRRRSQDTTQLGIITSTFVDFYSRLSLHENLICKFLF